MFNHTIIELLKTISIEEKNKLSDFISSPYFNKSKKVILLYHELIKYYPLFTKNLTKEDLFNKISPNRNYNDSTIRELLHSLQRLVLQFLVQERFNSMNNVQDDYLLKELTFRNQQKLYHRNIKRIESEMNITDNINTDYFYNRYILDKNKFNFGLLYNTMYTKRSTIENVKKREKELLDGKISLIIYFIVDIIVTYTLLTYLYHNFNINENNNFLSWFIEKLNLDEIIKHLHNESRYIFMIEIYYAIYKTIRYFDNEKYYYEYKNLVKKNSENLSLSEKNLHYTNLINYCMMKKKFHTKNEKYLYELQNLYEIFLEKEYYKNDNIDYLTEDTYRSILLLSIELLKDNRWISKFIEQYSKKLHPDVTDKMRYYGYAYLFNKQKDYEKSLDYINKVQIDNFNYMLDLKELSLMNFFELKYLEEALNLVHNYREYLRHHKMIMEEIKSRHYNFLSYIEKLILFKTGKIKLDISVIKKNLINCDQIISKNWLLEKIEEIESVS